MARFLSTKEPFIFHANSQQTCAISRLLYSYHAVLPCSLFCTHHDHDQNTDTSNVKQCGYATSVIEFDTCQSSSYQRRFLPEHNKSIKKSIHGRNKSLDREHRAYNVKRCGKIMTSLLHKTYWNMKDRQLIGNSDTGLVANSAPPRGFLQTSDLINLEKVFYPLRKRWSDDPKMRHNFSNLNRKVQEKGNADGHISKQIFYQKMRQKYQDPNDNEAAALAQCFPNPKQIFEDVAHPILEAKGLCVPHLVVTGHLRQVYWKAALTLSSTQTIVATHSDKEIAIDNVYMRACNQLEKLGWMRRGEDDKWQPMTSERVVSMLETLAKYIESSFVPSKGRGFKIILSQAEDGKVLKSNSTLDKLGCKSTHFSNTHHQNHIDCDTNRKDVMSSPIHEDKNCKWKDEDKTINCQFYTADDSYETLNISKSGTGCNHLCMSKVQEQHSTDSLEVSKEEKVKAKWVCTVHVGWPFPFTVRVRGVSLPGAQMLGYMEVARKLKSQGLLTRCNSALSPQVLGRLMLLDLQAHWEKSLNYKLTDTLRQKFAADAELFCDASISGFGAYLVLQDSGKVSWLCETWQDHDNSFLDIVYSKRWMFDSTLAEFYATVTSVYSWKKKLRGKRLLCFTDSQTTVGLINSFMANPVKEEYCFNTLDQLVKSLQTTCLSYSITLQAVWINRERNTLADLLSKKNTTMFCNTFQRAALLKTKAKKLNIPWSQYIK